MIFFFFPATGFYYCLVFVPRGLSGAATKQRFREMFRQAQHDRKLFSFVPLIDLYVSFLFVMATIGRQFSVEAPNTARALRSECFPLRHSERVRLRPCHSERSRGISWNRTVRLEFILAFPKRRGRLSRKRERWQPQADEKGAAPPRSSVKGEE